MSLSICRRHVELAGSLLCSGGGAFVASRASQAQKSYIYIYTHTYIYIYERVFVMVGWMELCLLSDMVSPYKWWLNHSALKKLEKREPMNLRWVGTRGMAVVVE